MQEHNNWIIFSFADLKAAGKLVHDEHDPLIGPAMVLAQQAAEKSLKAYLFFKEQPILKTHDLLKLVAICTILDQSFESLSNFASDLNPHISTSRYPDACPVVLDLTTAKILVQCARNIYEFVKMRID